MIEFYLGHGVEGMTILGMMGEAPKLQERETLEFIAYVLRRVAGRIPVVTGVSGAGTDNLVKLSGAAMDAGAAGVMIAPIQGLKTEPQLVGYFGEVIGALGRSIPVVYQDFPQATGVSISTGCFVSLVDAHESLVMIKYEDYPGLRKLSQIRAACSGTAHRRVSILVGNGGLFLPQQLRRGADGAMTGFAFPEMLVDVCRLEAAVHSAEAEDLFDAYLPLVCYEQQPGVGLAVRKEILRRRGAIRSARVRAPGAKLDAADLAEIDALLARQRDRLARVGRQQAA
jgi:4-hydroxy-tetrahydrodipicolinate synthase